MNTAARQLAIVGRSSAGRPRTFRVDKPAPRDANYRRLATTILGLDVATLAAELRTARLGGVDSRGRAA